MSFNFTLRRKRKAYADKFKDPKGLWTGFGANYYVFAYNTRKVSKQEAPKSWEDFYDPKWRGRIGMDPQEFRWMGAVEEYLGEEKARRIMVGLARQDIQWRNNHTSLAQLMIAGEFDIVLSFAHSIEDLKEKRAPVEWVRTLKPVVVDIQAVALASNVTHPNAAKFSTTFYYPKRGKKCWWNSGKFHYDRVFFRQPRRYTPARLSFFPRQ